MLLSAHLFPDETGFHLDMEGRYPLPRDVKIPMSRFESLGAEIVIVDTLTGFMMVRHPDEVSAYNTVFDRLEELALPADAMFCMLPAFRRGA